MNANELMIGDLLKWKEQPGFNDEDRNMVLRVRNIFDDVIKIDGRFEPYHISLFEPIPLTPEILEKSGFVANKHVYPYPYYEYEVKEIKVKVGFAFPQGNKTSYKEPWVYIDSECVFVEHLPCMFVHQLQHAFRLCGIEKEIVL